MTITKPRTFIPNGSEVLESAIRGFLATHPGLRVLEKQKSKFKEASYSVARGLPVRVVYRNPEDDDRASRVVLLSGGGSGHEPAHAGYVGSAMLDAAVCGNLFASPNSVQIETGLELIRSSKGILVIIKNYTGDKLNFTLAAQKFQFKTSVPVRLVVVADDVSIGRTRSARVGRRGLAGTVLVHKIAGAAAAAGLSLDEVAQVAEFANRSMGTIGVALDCCDVPGQHRESRLGADEVELGIGIHNEPGTRRITPRPSLDALIAEMLAMILSTEDGDRNYLGHPVVPDNCDVVVLINNLGGLSPFEIAVVTGQVCAQLGDKYQVKPARLYAGTFLTALNSPGFSITILNLPRNEAVSARILAYLDTPTDAAGWAPSISSSQWAKGTSVAATREPVQSQDRVASQNYSVPSIPCNPKLFTNIVHAVHSSLVAAEPEITRLDNIMGDGDCGTTLLAGSGGVVQALKEGTINPASLSQGTMSVADVISTCMGGTSGALYAVFFTAFASALGRQFKERGRADFEVVVDALEAALDSLEQVTAAREGDRTMMDALIPFVRALAAAKQGSPADALDQAVAAATAGCEATRNVESKFGRSTYVAVEDSSGRTDGIADPGAYGVVAIVKGVRSAIGAYLLDRYACTQLA